MGINVYFDSNIFGHLSENNSKAKGNLSILIEKVTNNELNILPSFEILEELNLIRKKTQKLYEKTFDVFRKLVDFEKFLKPHGVILKSDIVKFATNAISEDYYISPVHEFYHYINQVKQGKEIFDDSTFEKIYERHNIFKELSYNLIFCALDDDKKKQIREHLRNSNLSAPEEFRNLWKPNKAAETIVADFTKALNVHEKCKKIGLDKLLKVPSVNFCIGFILSSWYRQAVDNIKEKKSVVFDHYHAVLGGHVGNIVSDDKSFRDTLKRIPNNTISIMSLEKFISDK